MIGYELGPVSVDLLTVEFVEAGLEETVAVVVVVIGRV